MSLDLHFFPRPVDGDWLATGESAEQRSIGHPSNRDLVMWERIGQRLSVEMPTMERSTIDGERAFGDPEHGLQLRLTAGEIMLCARSGGRHGVDTLVVLDMVRRAAAIVETVTGLVAYDPRAAASFLHDDIDPFDTLPAKLRALAH